MAPHPTGETVEIVGISASTCGQQCEHHTYCGVVLEEDVLLCFRKVQVIHRIKEETAIAAVWVSDGIEQCHVGFLPRSYMKHSKKYDGALAQVIKLYEDLLSPAKRQKSHMNYGIALAAVLSYSPDNDTEVQPTTTTMTTATSPTASGSNKKRSAMPYFIMRSPCSRKKPRLQTTNSQPNNNNNTTATDEREEEKNNQSSSNDNNVKSIVLVVKNEVCWIG